MNEGQLTQQESSGSVIMGFAMGVGLNILQGLALLLILSMSNQQLTVLIIGLLFFGLFQLIYAIPLYFYLRTRHKTSTAKGLLIEACLVLLINATCWGAFYRR